jgi:hypothetical protein
MNRWRKFAAATPSDRRLLVEAAAFLLWARVGLALSPLSRVVLRHPTRQRREADRGAAEQIPRVGWAVETTARHSPLTLTCVPQALAALWMLQSRGSAARLIYGVASDQHAGFSAHAWVEVNGVSVVGGRAASGFTVLTSFPER